MPTGDKRGSYASGRARREQIMDAAEGIFVNGGYEAVSLADVARRAGITAPGLTHHFATKDALLLAIAERRFDRAIAVASAAEEDSDGFGTLRLMLRQTEIRASQPDLMQLFIKVVGLTADRGSAAHQLFSERYARVVGDLTSRFAECAARGLIRSDIDYPSIARDFIALSDGLQLQLVLSPGSVDMVERVRTHLDHLAEEIATNPEHGDWRATPWLALRSRS